MTTPWTSSLTAPPPSPVTPVVPGGCASSPPLCPPPAPVTAPGAQRAPRRSSGVETEAAGTRAGTCRAGSGERGDEEPAQTYRGEASGEASHGVGGCGGDRPFLEQAHRLETERRERRERAADARADEGHRPGWQASGRRGAEHGAEDEGAGDVDREGAPREETVVSGLHQQVGEVA